MLRLLTSARFKNFEDRYSGAWPVIHLKAIIALRSHSWFATGSQLSSLRMGVIWSYLRAPLTMRQTKFYTACNLLMLHFDVFAHTLEQ